MRFFQLPVGQSFEFQGKRWLKTTPLIAVNDADGSQKLIPRSANVQPIAVEPAPPEPMAAGSRAAADILAAHNAFYHSCLQAAADDTELQQAIEAAHQQFLNQLNLK